MAFEDDRLHRTALNRQVVDAAADSTPGSARMPLQHVVEEVRSVAGVWYRASGSGTCSVSTLCGSKPASTCRSAERLRSITPAPISSTTRQRDFADDEQAARADADSTLAASAFLQRVVELGPSGTQRRQRAGENAR